MQSCGFAESVLRKVKRGGHHAPYLHPDPDLAKANSPRGGHHAPSSHPDPCLGRCSIVREVVTMNFIKFRITALRK